jgi:hypothetical protein
VFLCWNSSKTSYKAIDVPVPRKKCVEAGDNREANAKRGEGDSEEIYGLLRDHYYAKRFPLRKYFLSPIVEQVKVCTTASHSVQTSL